MERIEEISDLDPRDYVEDAFREKDDLKCSICCDLLLEPVRLDCKCFGIFCRECIKKHIEFKHRLYCPPCRQKPTDVANASSNASNTPSSYQWRYGHHFTCKVEACPRRCPTCMTAFDAVIKDQFAVQMLNKSVLTKCPMNNCKWVGGYLELKEHLKSTTLHHIWDEDNDAVVFTFDVDAEFYSVSPNTAFKSVFGGDSPSSSPVTTLIPDENHGNQRFTRRTIVNENKLVGSEIYWDIGYNQY